MFKENSEGEIVKIETSENIVSSKVMKARIERLEERLETLKKEYAEVEGLEKKKKKAK